MNILNKEEAAKSAENLQIIQTCCNGCVFCRPQADENEDLDEYCVAKRLSKFKELGAEILSVRSDTENSDDLPRNYKVVNERACNLLRPLYWKGLMEHLGVDEEDFLDRAKKEIQTSCTFIIYIDGVELVSEESEVDKIVSGVIDTFRSIEESEIQAANVTIINPCVLPTEFVNCFRQKIYHMYADSDIPNERRTPWNMEYIPYQDAKDIAKLESSGEKESLSDEEFKSAFIKRHIDLSAKSSNAQYYSFFFSGDKILRNYLSDINNYINEDLNRLIALRGDEDISSGMLVQNLSHKQLSGNKGGYILDKIEQLTKDQECPELLKKIQEVVKNFK